MVSAKIAKILKSNSIEIAQDPILGHITKGSLFSSKTHFLITNKRFYIIDEKKTVTEKHLLTEDESFVCITKAFEILTDKRLIYLTYDDDHKLIISKEVSYLIQGEKFVAHTLGNGDFGQHFGDFEEDKEKELALNVRFNVLTNKSLKIFKGAPDLQILDVLDLSNIESVRLLIGKSMISECNIIDINLNNGKSRSISNGSFSTAEYTEDFPRKFCQEAKVSFAKPFVNQSVKEKLYIEFYPKSDLKWPLKCSSCLTETSNLKYKRLKVERDSNPYNTAITSRVGPASLYLDIPYCETCNNMFLQKAVKNPGFNGVTVLLEFTNETYAQEFIEINS